MDEDSDIRAQLREIGSRNRRVEAEKAWETSWFRIISIMAITYVIACFALYAIGNSAPMRNALIPVLGYLLSTQSLPFIKKKWIDNYQKRITA